MIGTRRLLLSGTVLMVFVCALSTSCGTSPDKKNEVLVLCGGSMRAAVEKIKADYEKTSGDTILTTYGGSGELCAQIQNTGRGDVYVCHDPFMPWAADKGLIGRWDTLAQLKVVIIVPKGNPKKITKLEDLAQPGLRLGIGNQTYSTSGQITKHLLAAKPFGADILKNVRVETKGHQQRCNDVALGTLDASIVWDAVASLYDDKLDVFPLSMAGVDAITSATYTQSDMQYVKVTSGVVKAAEKREAVNRFYDYLIANGPAVFTELGFAPRKD